MRFSYIPLKIEEYGPSVIVCINLVGALTIKTTLRTHSVLELTMIDPAIGWFEIVKDTNKVAASIQVLFDNTW
jgi:hypothetical protein